MPSITPGMEFPLLSKSFLEGPVVDRDGYQYFVTQMSDGIPRIGRDLLNEVLDGIEAVADLDCDLILAPEAMGIPLATGLTLRTGIPFLVVRKRWYGLPGEIEVRQRTGYSECLMTVNTVNPGERVVILDDVVDTGGTLKGAVSALREAGIVVTEIVVIFNRSGDIDSLSEEMGVPIRTLLSVGTEDGRPVLR